MSIRLFKPDDWKAVAEIYEQGLLTRNATFETQVPDYDSWTLSFPWNFIMPSDNYINQKPSE